MGLLSSQSAPPLSADPLRLLDRLIDGDGLQHLQDALAAASPARACVAGGHGQPPFDLVVRPFSDDAGGPRSAMVSISRCDGHDIDRLAFEAKHDSLTGLPNRSFVLERLTAMLFSAPGEHRQVEVLFIDLDHFELVNDTLGHHAGDVLLTAFAHRLQSVRWVVGVGSRAERDLPDLLADAPAVCSHCARRRALGRGRPLGHTRLGVLPLGGAIAASRRDRRLEPAACSGGAAPCPSPLAVGTRRPVRLTRRLTNN